jgi:hypothetical protein
MDTYRSSVGVEISEPYWRGLRDKMPLLFPSNIEVRFE